MSRDALLDQAVEALELAEDVLGDWPHRERSEVVRIYNQIADALETLKRLLEQERPT